MAYCEITKVEPKESVTGNDLWILTHACGKQERRVRRLKMERADRAAPTRVVCSHAKKEGAK